MPTTSLDIIIIGARKHNLKNITVQIPRHKITAITGVSGAGKSRFLESLSTRKLSSAGHAVVFVEHHPDMIKLADYEIELGPEGGVKGGYLLNT